ncbi:MAG: 1-acyl-sn-glycerol-3-phosphate acyltransferase, partial [Solirubrobacterales bacterium]|nr:1-acyl-sn-glycerol-3-phosphate acyltransferase [Solirubrobacterales bacterium]
DQDTIETAKLILGRGEIVLMFPEGTRTRPGSLGKPKRGVGRLALETGAAVVPIAIIGTEEIPRGWRIRPRKVRVRAGRALHFPTVENASPALAGAVTDRIWPMVMLQWEWLGGLPPIRRAAIIGAGAAGTSLAVLLARAGFEVELGCRTREQADRIAGTRVNEPYLPGVELPGSIKITRANDLELDTHDLLCLAVPARALPAVMGAHGEGIAQRAGVLVLSKGLVPPLGTLPSAFVAERCGARAVAAMGGPADAADVLEHGASVALATVDEGFRRDLGDALSTAGLDVARTSDVTGLELAGAAKNVAVLAAAAASIAGPNVAGAAAGKVFAEVDALARAHGGRPETFAGLAGTGDLVTAVVSPSSRNRRAGELLAQGVPAAEIYSALGHAVEAVDAAPLLASAARDAHVESPALDSLAALIEGRIEAEQWTASVTEPPRPTRKSTVRAA